MSDRLAPSTRAIERGGNRATGVMRLLANARDTFTMRVLPRRRMSEAERRALQRAVADDPAVDRALREFLNERPEFRRKDARAGDVQGQ